MLVRFEPCQNGHYLIVVQSYGNVTKQTYTLYFPHHFLCREQRQIQQHSLWRQCQCVSSDVLVCSSEHCPLLVCSLHHAVGAVPNTQTHTHSCADTQAKDAPITDSLWLSQILTFDLRNFLVSRWIRALSVSRFSEGRSVSLSLLPWEIDKQMFKITLT